MPSAGARPEEPDAAVERLRAAARSRAAHPRKVRIRQLKGLKRMLEENEQRLLDALAKDLHKSPTEARLTEIGTVRAEIDHAVLHLTDWMDPRPAKVPLALQPASAHVRARPKGMVLVIGAWNYPVQLLLGPLVPALAAGNTVVVSPSEKAPATARALQELLPQYLDPALISVVSGGRDCVQALLAHPWDHILYTGGERVGRIVYEAAAKTLSPVTLELGGKSPTVVTPSRNATAMARRIAFGKFTNAGQTCVAPDYVLAVGEVAHRQLLEHLPTAIREFYGEDPSASADYGRLVSAEHTRRLVDMLEEDVRAGARVVVGGRADVAGRYLEPTVVDGVRPEGALMREELFGPVLPILRVDTFQEALDFIADRPHPLAAYLFTDSLRYHRAFEDQVQAGAVSTDVTLIHAGMVTLPFGGVGPSGIGAYHGQAGFDTFSHLRPALTKSDQVDTLKAVYPPHGWLKRKTIPRML
ncbi:aldehyde dehydrogenase family protein [Micrococcus sp.]|uniref:aldehyde dehydrogenase family protein n=1 Tax=Micrococcus sp. TaxID=1271 RepID=UPI0039C65D45